MNPSYDFTGKVAFITGAGQGMVLQRPKRSRRRTINPTFSFAIRVMATCDHK